jgi:uncharacterized membrane protein HdeD (DUF308 family)
MLAASRGGAAGYTRERLPAAIIRRCEAAMLDALARNWWMVVLRGALAVIFGLMAIAWPDLTVGVFVAFFGAYALVEGVFTIVEAFQGGQDRLWHILQGALGILVGIVAWVYPDLTALSLLYFIGAWAIVTGVVEVIAAVRLRREIDNEWLLAIAGVLSVLWGLFLFIFPGDGAIALVTTIGIFAIIYGVVLIVFGLRLRGMRDQRPRGGATAPA